MQFSAGFYRSQIWSWKESGKFQLQVCYKDTVYDIYTFLKGGFGSENIFNHMGWRIPWWGSLQSFSVFVGKRRYRRRKILQSPPSCPRSWSMRRGTLPTWGPPPCSHYRRSRSSDWPEFEIYQTTFAGGQGCKWGSLLLFHLCPSGSLASEAVLQELAELLFPSLSGTPHHTESKTQIQGRKPRVYLWF